MVKSRLIITISSVLIIAAGIYQCNHPESETAAIEKVIRASIGWALDKDQALLYASVVQDSTLFILNPDSSAIRGFATFREHTEGFFMHPDFRAVSNAFRDLQINLSPNGKTAWFYTRLDDFNTWKGRPANWVNVRYTGVLIKQRGQWRLVQMHFSHDTH